MAQELVELPDKDFERGMTAFLADIKDLATKFSLHARNFLARCSHLQIREVKRRLKGIIDADHIDRLVLCGRGIIADHLAARETGLRACILRCLPRKALDILNKPDSVVDVLRPSGRVVPKRVDECSNFELSQIVDQRRGILGPEDQRRKLLTPKPDPKAKSQTPTERLAQEAAVRQDDGSWLVYLRFEDDAAGTRRYVAKVRLGKEPS